MNKLLKDMFTEEVRRILSRLVFEVENEHYDFHSDSIDMAHKKILKVFDEVTNETLSTHR